MIDLDGYKQLNDSHGHQLGDQLLVSAARAISANLRRMDDLNWMGNYGFYEAADYTQGKEPELVRSWMAHHQGMCLLALANLLKNNVVQRWFHGTPRVRAAELLLHEKSLSKETLKELSDQSKLQQVE